MVLRFIAVVGSLQADSSNAAVVRAMAAGIVDHASVQVTHALHELPPFNPDLDGVAAPAAVERWRSELAGADAIIFATPEYAMGVPGALKNALDWVVASGELVGKPVALVSASSQPRGSLHALRALETTARVMTADVVVVISVPTVRSKLDAAGEITDDSTLRALNRAAAALLARAWDATATGLTAR